MNRCNHQDQSTWKKGQGQSGPAMFCARCGKFIGYIKGTSEPKPAKGK